MRDKLLLIVRSSEFWVLLVQGVFEIIHSPIPEEFKTMGWFYIGARVVGKLVKLLFPQPGGTK